MTTRGKNLLREIFGTRDHPDIDLAALWDVIDTQLPERHSLIMHQLYDQSGERLDITHSDLATSLGISVTRLRQIRDRALRDLRHPSTRRRYVIHNAYAHRNGEHELPTVHGWYWYQGFDDTELKLILYRKDYEDDGNDFFDPIAEGSFLPWEDNRWWGPIEPPAF